MTINLQQNPHSMGNWQFELPITVVIHKHQSLLTLFINWRIFKLYRMDKLMRVCFMWYTCFKNILNLGEMSLNITNLLLIIYSSWHIWGMPQDFRNFKLHILNVWLLETMSDWFCALRNKLCNLTDGKMDSIDQNSWSVGICTKRSLNWLN